MREASYGQSTAAPVAALQGSRVHALQREGGLANIALMAVWSGTMLVVTVAAMMLDGRVPDAVLPWVALPIGFAGLVLAGLAHRRIATSGSRWQLHVARDRLVMERAQPPATFDLAHVPVRVTRYEYSFRGGRGAMPTVTIALPDGTSLVVSGPVGVGWQNLSEAETMAELGFTDALPTPPERSRAPHVRLDDAAAFEALSAAARRG